VSPLRQRMIEDMTIRNLSGSTQQSYIYAVARFGRHFQRASDRLGLEGVRAYQLHLVDQKYSRAHINQVACTLRLFYGNPRPEGGVRTDRQRQGARKATTGPEPR
jgi:integrase/recombinase XerD